MRKAGPLRADSARGLQETSVDTHGVTGLSDRYHQRVERVDAFATLTRAGGVIMKPSVAIAAHSDAIRRIVESNRAQDPRVFASVLHGGDHEESEIDILVGPTAETRHFDIRAIVDELKELLGVPVHLATPNALPAKTRDQIVAEAQPI